MSELSVFIDESGDFGPFEPHSPYYLIALVFHNQAYDIAGQVTHLRRHIEQAGFRSGHNVHSAPLIRRERDYSSLDLAARRKLFRAQFGFMRLCDISYKVLLFRKREFPNHDRLVSRMSRDLKKNYLKPCSAKAFSFR